MTSSFWVNYALAMVVVGLMLLGLLIVSRNLARGRALGIAGNRRLVTVLESTMLSQHVALHVIKAGEHYLLVGGGNNGTTTVLRELDADEVEAWLAAQRETAGPAGLRNALRALRGGP